MPIELINVDYAYEGQTGDPVVALEGVSLRIDDGEFVGIMGHTGCGKTTLIQMIAGLKEPARGEILLDGLDINGPKYDRRLLREKVGIVFQYPEYQLFETSVERDVAFGLKHSGLDGAEIVQRTKWALETMAFSYEDIRRKSPLSLSGGEKRRVAIAGVLVTQPKVLMFDEPIAGLDPKNRELFLQVVSRLQREGTTIIMVSHNVDALGEYAKRLIVMDHGRKVMDGSVTEVFSDLDRLKASGLRPCAPRALADMLAARGVSLPEGIVSYGALLEGIAAYAREGGAP